MRKLVTIQIIENLEPIPNADKIEVATIKGWKVVVEKNLHKIGEQVVYFEIDSFLPLEERYMFLLRGNSPKKMLNDGKEIEGIKLKTIKLRGQISQGLIMPLSILEGKKYTNDARENPKYDLKIGDNVSALLGVIKYEPPIPACIQAQVKGLFPGFLPKTDEPRIQNCAHLLNDDDTFVVTEKIDGTSATFFKFNGVFGVCSRNLELKDTVGNAHWDIAKKLEIEKILPDGYCIQGEIYGEGIQGNPLKQKGIHFAVYNVFNIKNGNYLDFNDFIKFCSEFETLKTVPVLEDNFTLKGKNVDDILLYAEGKSVINPLVEREGVVIRPGIEKTVSIEGALSRFSFKAISNKFLLKND